MVNYWKLIFATLVICETDIFAYPQELNAKQINVEDERIVGGVPIDITQAPYQVYVLTTMANGLSYSGCAGSILNTKFILSAAHCFVNAVPTNSVEIRIGSSDKTTGGKVYTKANFKLHPKYSSKTNDYDVAFIKTNEDMFLDGKSTRAIKLSDANHILAPGTELFVAGWGAAIIHGSSVQKLFAVTVRSYSTEECIKSWPYLTDRMMCAGSDKGGKGTCNGDSGGPIVWNGIQVGIVSYGSDLGCALPKTPDVSVKVSNPEIRQWIKTNTGA